jgi:adenylate cyclase
LNDAGSGIIGLDIVFSEADKTSPHYLLRKYHLPFKDIPDYDEILAKTIAQTPTILGYVFDFEHKNENEAPQIPAIFIQKHKVKGEFLPEAQGVLANYAPIQEAGYSSGFMNNIPDNSGIIRSVPLFISYDMQIYPSLAFEMYRIAMGSPQVVIDYGEAGINNIVLAKHSIHCDRFGRLYVNYRGGFRTFHYISAVDIFNNTFDKNLFQGKFVLIGTSAYGLMDLRATPIDNIIAGVEIHANVLDNLLNNDMLYKPSWIEVSDLVMICLITILIFFIVSRLSVLNIAFSFIILFFILLYFNYYMLFNKHIIINVIFPFISMFLSLIVVLGIEYLFESRQKEIIKRSFSKKVSRQVMEDLLKNPDRADLDSREVEATVYFSDIRSFTTISEKLDDPKEIVGFLNYYMNEMVKVIEKNSGTIDKFIGDAVMAYWNAPLSIEKHADRAVESALVQIAMRDTLNVVIEEKYGFCVDYGIGINTGNVVVGEVGSFGRSDYTIIGDAVNLASRLEGLCKVYKVRLVVSEFSIRELKNNYVIQLLDIVKVKGKHKPVKIYEILSKIQDLSLEKKQELLLYEQAHTLYVEAKFLEAEDCFKRLVKKYRKYLYTLYLQRCKHLQKEDVKDFNGVFEFTTK